MTFPPIRSYRPAILAASLVVLAGCAAVRPVAVAPEATAASFRERSLDDAGLRRLAAQPDAGVASWPPARLDARALDVAALYFNPSLQVARSKWQVAKAAIETAGQIPNPTVSVSPLYVTTATAGLSPWVVASSLVQIIETAGKRQFRLARAQYLAEAARLDVLNAAWDTVGRVNGALLDVAAAQGRAAAIERQLAAQSGLAEIAEKRLQAGLGSRLELTTVRTLLTRVTLDQQAARTTLVEARHQLAQAVGVPFEALPLDRLVIPSLDQALPPGFEARVRDTAALNRADLLARLADYAASAVALQLEVASRTPNVELGPNFEFDQGNRKWGVSLTAQVPVFNQNQGPIAEAAAQLRQAADQFVALQAGVIGEVDRAIAAHQAALRSLAVADRLYQQQTRQASAAEALFARGETDRLELLAARVELATAALGRADAQATVARARLAVELAGQLSPDGFNPATLALSETK